MLYFALSLAVTSKAFPLFRTPPGIVISITASEASVGVPLIVITADPASAATSFFTLAVNPKGRLLNHEVTSVSACIALNLSFVRETVTSCWVICVPVVPSTVTLLTAADLVIEPDAAVLIIKYWYSGFLNSVVLPSKVAAFAASVPALTVLPSLIFTVP